MAMTYSALTGTKGASGALRTWINKEVPADEILTDAEAYIYRRLRVREMLSATTGTATTSTTAVAVPDSYLATVRLQFTTPATFTIDRVTTEEVEDLRIYDGTGALVTGQPSAFTVFGTSAEFDIACSTDYTYRWTYFAQPTALSTDNETNWLTAKAPRLMRAACLAMANEYFKDDAEKVYWLQVAETEMSQLMVEDDFEKRGLVLDRGGL